MSAILEVRTTVPTRAAARRIADALVAERLAACAQILGPAFSTYRWRGRTERAQEYVILLKTTSTRYAALERRLSALHPYDVPEILAVRVPRGLAAYRRWVAAETRGA
jgi:periplasmic divalent cation tolerance protein